MAKFGEHSTKELITCHEDLQKLFNEVIKHRDCTIIEGMRNKEKQNEAFRSGFSNVKYPSSNHNYDPSLAVDVMPCPIDWDDKEGVIEFAGFVMGIASQLDIQIKWGGHYKTLFDSPHYQLIRV